MARKSDTYKQSFSRNGDRKRGFSLLNLIVGVLTLLLAVVLLCSYVSQWIDPSKGGTVFAYLPLVMPILYLLNLVALLFWIVRWKRMVVVPFVVGLIGIGGVSLFYNPQYMRQYEGVSSGKKLKVMTFNAMGMNVRENNRLVSAMTQIAEVVDSIHPDILCIQEFQSTSIASRKDFNRMVPWLSSSKVLYKIDTSNDHGWGQAVYSRYPIIKSGNVDFKDLPNSALWCDIVVKKDTLRVINIHLQSTSITTDEQQYINNMSFVTDTTRQEQFRNMYHKLGLNYKIRAEQAKVIRRAIDEAPYDVIVCGDFNDTPMSFTYHEIADELNDSYQEVGYGPSYTYKSFFNLLRIDYILYSDGLTATSYESPYFECSDHKPVVVTFDI
ncbi:MAG: endonuclease/exonuclease/phosphatase family protein [Rikenellaceae bacterium]|nr:endonuclease/exonuclease/phosphatase family protein [Rikenellaceae bacterium]